MQHPIGVVSARTGLSPDVIRVWERRYGVVDPARDDAGRRLYSDEDLERLWLLARATAGGRGIGQVAELGREELEAVVREDESARWSSAGRKAPRASSELVSREEAVVERALALTRALDRGGLEAELRRAATLLELPSFLEGVVAPLFVRIGDEWHAGRLSVAQEHLATSASAAVIGGLIASAGGGEAGSGPVLVVATLPGDRHELGALLVAAAASAHGWRVVYLGPDVPPLEIVGAAVTTGARCVALSVVYGSNGAVASEVAVVRAGLPSDVRVVVGGAASEALADVAGVQWLGDLAALGEYLAG
jgi:MerR family transcriptional regulator, light-induced transcriptional regulator